jgi:hypothetical protein
MPDNYTPQESWNMATETMKRLSRLLDQNSLYAQNGDLIRWFQVMMDLRRNLIPFIDKPELEELNTKLSSLPKGWMVLTGSGTKVKPIDYPVVNRILDEIYILLIKTMKAKGLLMPKTIDVRKSVLDM